MEACKHDGGTYREYFDVNGVKNAGYHVKCSKCHIPLETHM